jgi:eukaryotic-like serine/threonine-protein kinase
MSDLVGTVISSKYELTKFLGEGGLGRVFLAEQKPMGRQVALKLLHPELSCDASLSARFEREALAASRISHPNSVVIHDFGSDVIGSHKQLYLVMEFLKGETLHERIQGHPKRRLPAWDAVHILAQVLRPLAAFHKAGVIHRDLKPDNIMLCQSDIGEQVKLLDFGIAKVSGSSLTATGQMVGTPHYMAPEQITASKELGPTVDIYAMGVLLYEALTGDPPYLAEHHIDLFRMHLLETPKALAERFPEEPYLKPFDAVIRKAMSKKPADRYQSADELRQAMEAALVTSVAQEQESLEVTQARKRLTPSWWLEQKRCPELVEGSTTEASEKSPATLLLHEEDSTNDFAVHNAQTISMEKLSIDPLRVDETVKMEKLELPSREWLLSEVSTVPEVRPHPTWVRQSSGFWKRVSRLWQFFKK